MSTPNRIHFEINFLEDSDDSYNQFTEHGIYLPQVPTVGSCVKILSYYHRVKDVVFDEDAQTICLHLGKSAESAEEARSPGYGLWNKE